MSAPCLVVHSDLKLKNPGWTDFCENLPADCCRVPQSGLADLAIMRLLLGAATGGQALWTHVHVGKPFCHVRCGLQDHSTRLFKIHTVNVILLLLLKLRGEVCVDFEQRQILVKMCMML